MLHHTPTHNSDNSTRFSLRSFLHFARVFFAVQKTFLIAIVLVGLHALANNAFATLNILGDSKNSSHSQTILTSKNKTSAGNQIQTAEATVQLLAHAPNGIQAGQTFQLGLRIQHAKGWHTYWKNPGDSGLPTRLTLTLPEGMQASPLRWPVPHAIPIGDLTNYGYERDVLLPLTVTVADGFSPNANNTLHIKAHAYWLVCKDVCVPQEGQLTLDLPINTPFTEHQTLFENAGKETPLQTDTASIKLLEQNNDHLRAEIANLPTDWHKQTIYAFPEQEQTYTHQPHTQHEWQPDGALHITLPLQPDRLDAIEDIALVLAPKNPTNTTDQYNTNTQSSIRVHTTLNTPIAPPKTTSTPIATTTTNATTPITNPITTPTNPSKLSLLTAMLFAFLGGSVLNLMPCVFPVLAIKALSFVKATQPRERIGGGIAYSVGVVLSFALLGGSIWLLRSAGNAIGWGFQLQSPWFVSALAILFVLIALNLFGLFEVRNFLPSSIANAQSKNPITDSFLSGVLAVAIASPCTAPLMGAALGYAMGLPALQALLVFIALGVGMALPYLLLACIPALARLLPQPGAWMERFKQFMAFPMLITVVWLLWVLGLQVSIHFSALLLLVLICVSMAVWAFQLQNKAVKWLVIALSIALITGTYIQAGKWGLLQIGTATPPNTSTPSQPSEAITWQPWSEGTVQTLKANKQAYFIDFTAAWCITCQYNKANVLSQPDVLRAFQNKNVTLLRADWTRQDPAITNALKKLGRTGIPVYVLYLPNYLQNTGGQTTILNEVLDKDELLALLSKE